MAEQPLGGSAEDAGPRRSWWQWLTGTAADHAGDRAGSGPVFSALARAAQDRGWTVEDEDSTATAELTAVLEQAPLRLTRDHHAATVVRGRVGSWELVAFDVVYAMPRGVLTSPRYAVTAVPVPIPLPAVRVAPRRFLTHGAGGLLVLPSDDPAFDARWQVLSAADTPEVRGLVAEPVRAALLAGPDLDELWTAGGHVAVSRVDGHHGRLLDEHSALLAAAMAGLQRAL